MICNDGEARRDVAGSLKLRYHLESPRSDRASRDWLSGVSSPCVSERGVDAGVELYEPLVKRCLFDSGADGVEGLEAGEGPPRCMNYLSFSES